MRVFITPEKSFATSRERMSACVVAETRSFLYRSIYIILDPVRGKIDDYDNVTL